MSGAGPQLARYRAGSSMPLHAHGEPWLCLVLEGRYAEQIRARETEHGPGELLFCPAEEPHQQRFGRRIRSRSS